MSSTIILTRNNIKSKPLRNTCCPWAFEFKVNCRPWSPHLLPATDWSESRIMHELAHHAEMSVRETRSHVWNCRVELPEAAFA